MYVVKHTYNKHTTYKGPKTNKSHTNQITKTNQSNIYQIAQTNSTKSQNDQSEKNNESEINTI